MQLQAVMSCGGKEWGRVWWEEGITRGDNRKGRRGLLIVYLDLHCARIVSE